MGYISVKNWQKFQHYGDRRKAVWIKLYTSLLDQFDDDGQPNRFLALPERERLLLVCLWLLAGRHNNRIPLQISYLESASNMLAISNPLKNLVSQGFATVEDDFEGLLAGCYQNASTEEEIRKKKEEEIENGFEYKPLSSDEQMTGVEEASAEEPKTRGKRSKAVETAWVMDLWNERADAVFPRCTSWTADRKKHAKARVQELPDRDDWELALAIMNASQFHRGDNQRSWKANIDWLLRPGKLVSLLERSTAKSRGALNAAPPAAQGYQSRRNLDAVGTEDDLKF